MSRRVWGSDSFKIALAKDWAASEGYLLIPKALLREAAAGWEPGPGPFTVPLPTVNKILNLLHDPATTVKESAIA